LTETITNDKYLYEKGKGRGSFQKNLKDKKKDKYDQIRKGFKPPFNRDSPNTNKKDQHVKNESTKEESLGKNGRTPIKCWGCK
jgi:hypothetical protein